jgi:hypothetical protein
MSPSYKGMVLPGRGRKRERETGTFIPPWCLLHLRNPLVGIVDVGRWTFWTGSVAIPVHKTSDLYGLRIPHTVHIHQFISSSSASALSSLLLVSLFVPGLVAVSSLTLSLCQRGIPVVSHSLALPKFPLNIVGVHYCRLGSTWDLNRVGNAWSTSSNHSSSQLYNAHTLTRNYNSSKTPTQASQHRH